MAIVYHYTQSYDIQYVSLKSSTRRVNFQRECDKTAFPMTSSDVSLPTDDDYPGCDMCDCPHRHYW